MKKIAIIVMVFGAPAAAFAQTSAASQDGSAARGMALVMIGIVAYFVPAIVASGRHHRNSTAIFALNFLLGWTVLGWIFSFVWSLTDPGPGPKPA